MIDFVHEVGHLVDQRGPFFFEKRLKRLEFFRDRHGLGAALHASSGSPEVSDVLATAVVGQHVRGVLGDVGQHVLRAESDQVLLQAGWSHTGARSEECRVGGWAQGKVVREQAGNVGRSHRGTGQSGGSGVGANVGRQDVQSRSENVNAFTVVGEVGSGVRDGRGAHGDGKLGRSRRRVASVAVLVTCGHSEMKTHSHSSVHRQVQSGRLASSQGHVGGRALEALLGGLGSFAVGFGGILHTLNDVRHRAGSVGSQHLDSHNLGLLGHTVGIRRNRAGTVGSVAVSVLVSVAVRNGGAPRSSSVEFHMLHIDTSVDNVGSDTVSALSVMQVAVEGVQAQWRPV